MPSLPRFQPANNNPQKGKHETENQQLDLERPGMNKTVSKVWMFQSDSNPDTQYETLQYTDGSTSCNCKGWTRRVAANGSRSCKHTRLVDMQKADLHCTGSHNYQQLNQTFANSNHEKRKTIEIPKLGHRKLTLGHQK